MLLIAFFFLFLLHFFDTTKLSTVKILNATEKHLKTAFIVVAVADVFVVGKIFRNWSLMIDTLLFVIILLYFRRGTLKTSTQKNLLLFLHYNFYRKCSF